MKQGEKWEDERYGKGERERGREGERDALAHKSFERKVNNEIFIFL